ncbi:MAG TPA: T9SS type A sorting domain-containing protein [Bacteroidia bacterium]|nr:T9SS type A sorting domain-containing protein [Bacteroidia bacterium]
MKTLSLLTATFFFNSAALFAQSNCANPTKINICPSANLVGETNSGMGDDAPAACNIAGEDVVYEISAPNGAQQLYVSIKNATAPLNLSVELTTCGNGVCSQQVVPSGNTNVTFTVASASIYYLWIDAAVTVTYDISIGGDTGSVWVSIPNTQGNLRFDSSGCAAPPFLPSKPFFQVKYNGIYKTSPMTLSPLFTTGTMCIIAFFKNTTGIEGIKKFVFHFNPSGYSSVTQAASIPGFYNTGNWVSSINGNDRTFEFFDLAATGKGDFTGTPNSCLRYEFCFNLVPISNIAQFTNVKVDITSDGFGAGFTGFINSGCCPGPVPNCLGGAGAGSNAHSFGFGFDDPGALPVSLTAFNATLINDKVYLSWTTASETNNDYFTVEKSQNKEEWIIVDKIKGAGNSTTVKSYELIDVPFHGITYYRLKQTDFNGAFLYSMIKKVYYNQISGTDIYIYPNPASNLLTVAANGISDLSFTFINVTGKKIQLPVTIWSEQARIETSHLPSGLYLLVVEKGTCIIKKEKIVIQK